MRMMNIVATAMLITALATTAIARSAATTPSADALVTARQAAFRLNLASFLAIKAAIARGDDVKTLALPAGAMAAWARAMPGLFPVGSTNASSKALPTIWRDRAGFEAAAANMATVSAKLNELAKAGDVQGFTAQYAELGATCNACHDKYRAEDKR